VLEKVSIYCAMIVVTALPKPNGNPKMSRTIGAVQRCNKDQLELFPWPLQGLCLISAGSFNKFLSQFKTSDVKVFRADI
jgi:hypothetical protein